MSSPASDNAYPAHLKSTLRLAAPLVVGQLSAMGLSVVDSVIAGRLGPAALGGVAVGGAVYSFSLLLTIGVLGSVTPTVAQLFGAKRFDEIAPRARQAWWLALVPSALLVITVLSAAAVADDLERRHPASFAAPR